MLSKLVGIERLITLFNLFLQERPPTSSIMLSSKKSDAGSASSSSSSAGTAGGERVQMVDAQTGPSASSGGPMDVKKKERSSPSGEPGGAPLPHQAGPGGADQDSAEVRRTSRRKRAKVNILGFCLLQEVTGLVIIAIIAFEKNKHLV